MTNCPDCFEGFDTHVAANCNKCGWTVSVEDGIVEMLSSHDRKDNFFRSYVELYESIAESEVAEPVNSDNYVRSMARFTASLLGDLTNKNVCDVGSGKGFLLQEIISKEPGRVTAVDIARNYLKKIQVPGLNRIVANAENLPFLDEFDVVVSTDVMEHVLNVGSFIFSINKMLKLGGTFVVRVPYRENLLQYGRCYESPYPFTHLRTYNLDLLEHQMVQAGFKKIKFVFDGFQPAYPRQFFRTKVGKWFFKRIVLDNYSDYWDVTRISKTLGFLLMRPIEVNMIFRKITDL